MATEQPGQTTKPSPRRLRSVVIGAAVIVAATIGFVLLQSADDAPNDNPDVADVPRLQDLAELAADTPQDEDAAPDFSVKTRDGGAFTLSRHLADDGRPVILNLWASWCFPCRQEMPALDAFATAHPEIAVVGVSVQDDQAAAEQFADEIGVSYTLGFDEKDEVNNAYRPLGLPATFLIVSNGTIVKRVFGGVNEESLEADIAEYFAS